MNCLSVCPLSAVGADALILSYCAGDNGHFYCGQRPLTCSCCQDHVCGPTSGCNCSACKQLDAEAADVKQHSETSDSSIPSAEIINSWTWGKQPGLCHN